jgi:hypothetical protein
VSRDPCRVLLQCKQWCVAIACPIGYSTTGTGTAGTGTSGTITAPPAVCTVCAPGYEGASVSGASGYTACIAGQYKMAFGNDACSICAVGSHGPAVALSGVSYLVGNTPPSMRTFSSVNGGCNDPLFPLLDSTRSWCATPDDLNANQ